ncbi:LPXTG cell wall anchor domain-containing protein [Bifidobacterium adolescentis]
MTNTPGVVLPGTGGEGVNKMYAAGFLAVAIAVAGLALSLRRRQ